MSNKINMTCIRCPMGCNMEVEKTEENILVKYNGCKRGEEYAKKELTNPTRTLTSTITVKNGNLKTVPVKSDREISKELLMQCMEVVKKKMVTAPVCTGDILIENILKTNANIVACYEVKVL